MEILGTPLYNSTCNMTGLNCSIECMDIIVENDSSAYTDKHNNRSTTALSRTKISQIDYTFANKEI